MRLNTKPNLSPPDLFYTSLTDVHQQLNREQSESVNARLVLLLPNHIGLMEVLK
jgi:hypothetical protein